MSKFKRKPFQKSNLCKISTPIKIIIIKMITMRYKIHIKFNKLNRNRPNNYRLLLEIKENQLEKRKN